MLICSKLGQNLSQMEVRTFVRIQRVSWDNLLASKAEIIQKQGSFFKISFHAERGHAVNNIYGLLRFLFCFLFHSHF